MAQFDDKVVDFSDFPKKEAARLATKQAKPSPAKQPILTSTAKKLIPLIVILIILVVGLIVLLVWIKKTNSPPSLPAGYHMVTPPNQPAYIEKD